MEEVEKNLKKIKFSINKKYIFFLIKNIYFSFFYYGKN